ncbi:hypothetical protein BB559_003855 [Furculomyces boomerangus]|uniref:Transcription initiation factor IIF subunit alpha n=1 Tax=Furculomyces boomerangus TaxID=61424 RepID=A0A2T9YIE0_9FUNG|nr:hypothetical protein BB559_003855 [Furculomyces boomerangus]
MSSGLRPFKNKKKATAIPTKNTQPFKKNIPLVKLEHENTLNSTASSSSLSNSGSRGLKPNNVLSTRPVTKIKNEFPPDYSSKSSVEDNRQFTDYRLVSSERESTHNVMRFLTSQNIDPKTFIQPIKLRRREKQNSHYYNSTTDKNGFENDTSGSGNTNQDESGKSDVKFEEVLNPERASNQNSSSNQSLTPSETISRIDSTIVAPFGGGARNKQLMFKKRTKQVFFADEQQRKLNIEESRPWILEDFDGKQNWTGTLEGGQKSNYVLFVLMEDGFKVVPVNRWYKFAPKVKYDTLTLDEAELELKKSQKNDGQDRWIMKKRSVQQETDTQKATGTKKTQFGNIEAIIEKKEANAGESTKNFKKYVDYNDNTTLEDDDESGARKKKGNANGDIDEIDFEEVFEDDEEMAEDLFENIEEDTEKDKLKSKGNALEMKQLMRKLEKNKAYDSDKEENPYDSDLSDQSDDEDFKKSLEEKQDQTDQKSQTAIGSQSDNVQGQDKDFDSKPRQNDDKSSRIHLATQKKRKRIDSEDTNENKVSGLGSNNNHIQKSKQPKSSDRIHEDKASSESSSLISEQEIISLIKNNNLTIKDLISKIKRKLRENPANRQRISEIVKRVATQKDGVLVLKGSK